MEDIKSVDVNHFSNASFYVESCFDDIVLSNATCFFVERNEKVYLVTNWHVVSGRDADTYKCLDKNAAVPNNLRVYLGKKVKEGSFLFDDDIYATIQIKDEEDNSLWYEKSIDGKMIDVVLVPIKKIEGFDVFTIDEAEYAESKEVIGGNINKLYQLYVTAEIYIVGFPFGRITDSTPIWKKASVASEPNIDIKDMPYYFADTATKKGMSGSPVVARENNGIFYKDKEGKLRRTYTKLAGIYSGRIGADSEKANDAQLGRVWKVNVIEDILKKYVDGI